MALLERFFPDIYVKSVFELPLEDLKKLGIRGLVFDIDNTVAPFDVCSCLTAGLVRWQSIREASPASRS